MFLTKINGDTIPPKKPVKGEKNVVRQQPPYMGSYYGINPYIYGENILARLKGHSKRKSGF